MQGNCLFLALKQNRNGRVLEIAKHLA